MKNLTATPFLSFFSGAFVARCSALLVFVCLLAAPLSAQNTKPKVSVQGTLKSANGATVEDGQYAVTFNLYDVATGGTVLWFENASIEVIGGIYSYYLGTTKDLVPANFAKTLFLGIKIGSYELVPRSELSYAPYAFSVASAQTVLCSGAVGDVKYSILNPADFAKENGTCWVPMDGRSLAGSKLATHTGSYSSPNLPNGGGFFLRSQEFANSNQDEGRDTNTAIATGQGDDFESHTHGGVKDRYVDQVAVITTAKLTFSTGANALPEDAWLTSTTSGNYLLTGDNSTGTDNNGQGLDIHSSSSTRTTSATGGTETRPKNLNFWIYIRIN